MCQLCLVNLGSKKRNIFWMTNALIINSQDSHQDGVGILDTGDPEHVIWKSAHGASNTTNLADCVNLVVISNKPIIGHVRLASAKNKLIEDIITKEKAHPFLSPCKEFILAHNGTLEFSNNDDKRKKLSKYSKLIDTEIFTAVLSINYRKKRLMFTALKETMKDFKGKFAFLIYSIREDTTFIVRGKTAKLYKTTVLIEGKEVGWIINTEKDSLFDTMRLFQQNWFLATKQVVDFKELDEEGHTVEELKEESIYCIKGNKLKLLGEIEENYAYKRTVAFNNPIKAFPAGSTEATSSIIPLSRPFTSPKVKAEQGRKTHGQNYKKIIYGTLTFDKIVDSIIGWSNAHNMTMLEMDYLFSLAYGHGFSGANIEELRVFIKEILATLSTHDKKKKRKKGWNKILQESRGLDGMYMYSKNEMLEFPWMLNTKETLVLVTHIMKEQNRATDEALKEIKDKSNKK